MSGATPTTICEGVAAAFRLVPGITSAIAYLEQPPPSLPCAVVLPPRCTVTWAPDGALLHTYDLTASVLLTPDTSATELVAQMTTVMASIWTTFLAHLGACGPTTCLTITAQEPTVQTYLKQRYAAIAVTLSVSDERAELPDLGAPLV